MVPKLMIQETYRRKTNLDHWVCLTRSWTVLNEDNTDDGPFLQFVGDQGDGGKSQLCHHCRHMQNKWPKWIQSVEADPANEFCFPHHEDIFDLEKAALSDCALCYQFWTSSTVGDIGKFRNEVYKLGLDIVSKYLGML